MRREGTIVNVQKSGDKTYLENFAYHYIYWPDELDNYDPDGSQQQIQLPLVQSTDSTLYHSSDGPTIEKV